MRHFVLAGCLLLLLACDDSLSSGAGGRVRIISTVERDTIDATHDLVVEVRTPSGLPASGVEVVFQVSDTNDAPLRWLTLEVRSGCCFSVTARDTTDGQGRASVTVIHGPVAGPGLVLVTATGFGETDTARITTTHGAAVGSRVLPADRPIALGSSYQLSALLADRYSNTFPAPVTFSTASPQIELSATGLVRGVAIGRAKIVVQVGTLTDSAVTSVVPDAILGVRDYSGAVGDSTGYGEMDLDGSNYRRLFNTDVMPIEYSPSNMLAPQWIPGTGQLVHLRTVAGVTRLFVGDSTGAAQRLIRSPGEITAESDPDVSADGAWVYFVGHSASGDAVWRVAAAGGVPEKLIPSSPSVQLRSPSVSPDGGRLVYVSASYAGDQFHAYVRDLTTGETVPLSANEAAGPRWSPAGNLIMYAVSGPYAGYSGHLHVISPDGTGDRVLSNGAYFPGGTWSTDGLYVVVIEAEIPFTPELINVASGLRLPLVYQRMWYGPAWRR